jgi:hypothetical protein
MPVVMLQIDSSSGDLWVPSPALTTTRHTYFNASASNTYTHMSTHDETLTYTIGQVTVQASSDLVTMNLAPQMVGTADSVAVQVVFGLAAQEVRCVMSCQRKPLCAKCPRYLLPL